jgi:cyclic pyranopterin monophosphate synthase
MTNPLTHFNKEGRARMVDVGDKNITQRIAIATGQVYLKPSTMLLIKDGDIKKGDVLAVAQVAGIMGAKKTSDIIPMCHPLLITNVDIAFNNKTETDPETGLCCIEIKATVKVTGQTGVEMEALAAVSIAALTIYDMCKAVDREMFLKNIGLIEKSGGKSGTFSKKSVGI